MMGVPGNFRAIVPATEVSFHSGPLKATAMPSVVTSLTFSMNPPRLSKGNSVNPTTKLAKAGTRRGPGAENPTDSLPLQIPPGSFVVEVQGETYSYEFNSGDVLAWPKIAESVFTIYIKHAFIGGSEQIAKEYLKGNRVSIAGGADAEVKEDAKLNPTCGFNIVPHLHEHVAAWLLHAHPEVRPRDRGVGVYELEASKSRPVPYASTIGSQENKGVSTKLEHLRLFYIYLRKRYITHSIFQIDHASFEELLNFLANHAAEMRKSADFDSRNLDWRPTLSKWQDWLRRRASLKGEGKNSRGTPAWFVPFLASGSLRLIPDLQHYVAGSTLKMRVEFDNKASKDSALLNYFPQWADFQWTIRRDGKGYDSGPFFQGGSIEYEVKLKQPGVYSIDVSISSPRFENGSVLRLKSPPIVVLSEFERDQEIFEKTLVGQNNNQPFLRNGKTLILKPNQKPFSLDEEYVRCNQQIGITKELLRQGRITLQQSNAYIEILQDDKRTIEKLSQANRQQPQYLVRGTFLSRENSTSTEINAFMYRTKRECGQDSKCIYQVILWDRTLRPEDPTQHPGEGVHSAQPMVQQSYVISEGEALEDMARHWHSYNDYPDGTIHVAIVPFDNREQIFERKIDTYTVKKTVKNILGYASLGAGIVMLAASPFSGGGSGAVGLTLVKVAFIASAATGLSAMSLEIRDRIEKEGTLKFDGRLALDVLNVIGLSAGGVGVFSKLLQNATLVSKGMYLLGMAGLDAGQAVLLAAQVRQQLIDIDCQYAVKIAQTKDESIQEQLKRDRDAAIAQVIGAASVNGGFMLVSLGSTFRSLRAIGRLSGKLYNIRENIKLAIEQGDPESLLKILTKYREGRLALTDEEVAFLQEAIATARTDTIAVQVRRERLSKFLQPEVLAQLSEAHVNILSALEDEALMALSSVTTKQIRGVAKLVSQNPDAANGILKAYYYKFIKKEPKEPPLPVDEFLQLRLGNYLIAAKMGYPFGFSDVHAYLEFKEKILQALRKWKLPIDEICIQGGAITTNPPKDMDIAVLVDKGAFDLLYNRMKESAIPSLRPEIDNNRAKGVIKQFHFERILGEPSFAQKIYGAAGPYKIQLSIVLRGGSFDIGPYLRF